ncbi:hypothetical protein TA3x_005134 [Tundrisphaera sp. TA3]|uniref:hypothetical protein n=1 Tax=Tundrisphaera sp. TA3 TaxID=3435775 RepID=UPI003EBCDB76
MTEDHRTIWFMRAVARRPKMYTTDGTYEEMIAFLDGFYGGMAKEHDYHRATAVRRGDIDAVDEGWRSHREVWTEFKDWLSDRHGVPTSRIFEFLREGCRDNQEKVKRFSIALDEFSRLRPPS